MFEEHPDEWLPLSDVLKAAEAAAPAMSPGWRRELVRWPAKMHLVDWELVYQGPQGHGRNRNRVYVRANPDTLRAAWPELFDGEDMAPPA